MHCTPFTYMCIQNHNVWLLLLSASTAASCVVLQAGPQRLLQWWMTMVHEYEHIGCCGQCAPTLSIVLHRKHVPMVGIIDKIISCWQYNAI